MKYIQDNLIIIGGGGFCKQLIDNFNFDPVKTFIIDETTKSRYKLYDTFDINLIPPLDCNFVLGFSGLQSSKNIISKKIDKIKTYEKLGYKYSTLISDQAYISKYSQIQDGVIALKGVYIEGGTIVKKGCTFNVNVSIHHDCEIEEYCEVSPNVVFLGASKAGKRTFIGAGAVIHPKVTIGDDCTIGAGCVIKRNIPDGSIVKNNYDSYIFKTDISQ